MSQDVVAGYDPDHYEPNLAVDRGQIAAFVARAMGWVSIDDDMSTAPELFPDVPAGFWAGTAIQACVENGVVQGYNDGHYRPEWIASRDQMAVYMCRAFRLPTPYNISDYFPLGEGDTWTYSSEAGPYTETVSGTEELLGEVYKRLVHADGFTQYHQTRADGLRTGGWYHPDDDTAVYDPPTHIPNGLYPGDSDSQSLQLYLNGEGQGEALFAYEFLGLEDVTVPAGTFENCLKFRAGIELPLPGGDDHTDLYLWVAEGVGKVKRDERPFGGTAWEELASATVGGVAYPQVSVFVETKYWESGSYQLRLYAWAAVGDVSSITISGPPYLATATVVRPPGPNGDDPTRLYDDGLHFDGEAGDGYWMVMLHLDTTPQAGDTITFSITFADASSDTKEQSVTAVYSQTATLISPPDGSTVTSLTPTFQWFDAPISNLAYQVQVDDLAHNRIFDSPEIHGGTGIYTIPSSYLHSGTAYLWLVSGLDADGNEVLTEWDTFTTP